MRYQGPPRQTVMPRVPPDKSCILLLNEERRHYWINRRKTDEERLQDLELGEDKRVLKKRKS